MRREYCFYTYIMASDSGTLYIGVTNNLRNRVCAHKKGVGSEFTNKYSCHKLIYYEEYQYIDDAIAREKQLKGWRREKKQNLVHKMNPRWEDLSAEWTVD